MCLVGCSGTWPVAGPVIIRNVKIGGGSRTRPNPNESAPGMVTEGIG